MTIKEKFSKIIFDLNRCLDKLHIFIIMHNSMPLRGSFCNRMANLSLLCFVPFFLLSSGYGDYTRKLDNIAKRIASGISEGRTVVVFNILKDGNRETRNSIDLGIKLGLKLSERGKGKFKVIDRTAGERLYYEETRYTPSNLSSSELKQLLERFKADVGVVGEYRLIGRNLYLENIRAVEVPSPEKSPNILSSFPQEIIELSPQDSAYLFCRDVQVSQPDSSTDYLLSATSNSNFVSSQIISYPDNKLISNNCVEIGEYYRLQVKLTEDAFLYIFSYDEDNTVLYLLHPIEKEENRIIKSGEEPFMIPAGDFAIEARPPAGKNFVKIFACRKPIPVIIPNSEDRRLTPAEIKNFVSEIKKLLPNDWASFRIFIHIKEK